MIKLRPLVPAFPPTPKPVAKKLPEPEVLILEEETDTRLALVESSEKKLLAAKTSNSWVTCDPDKNLVEVILEARETGYRSGSIIAFLTKLDEDFKDIVEEYYRVKRLWEAKVSERARESAHPTQPEYFTHKQYHWTPPRPKQQEYYSYTPPPQRKEEPKKEVQFFKENVDPKVVEKVRKLLRLSESPHKGESDAAMSKAREISSKYGIILETISKY